jgi:serine phosphatase RsbU (regulator of sigma subunit)
MMRDLELLLQQASFGCHVSSAVQRIADAMRTGDEEVLFATLLDVMRGLLDADAACLIVETTPGELKEVAVLGMPAGHVLQALVDTGLTSGVFAEPREITLASTSAVVIPLGVNSTCRIFATFLTNQLEVDSSRRELVMMLAPIVGAAIESAIVARRQMNLVRLQSEMALAHAVQSRLDPRIPRGIAGFEFATYSKACDETGGDYHDFVRTADSNSLALLLGDISGHGIAAALMMLSARASVRAHLYSERDPSELLKLVNLALCGDDFDGRYLTLFFALLDLTTGVLEYASAGQECPLLFRASGEVEELDSTGMPLGLFPEGTWKSLRVAIGPGDLLLAASDGLIEAMSPSGDMYGRERVTASVQSARRFGVDAVVAALKTDVEVFCKGAFRDDVTLLVLASTA